MLEWAAAEEAVLRRLGMVVTASLVLVVSQGCADGGGTGSTEGVGSATTVLGPVPGITTPDASPGPSGPEDHVIPTTRSLSSAVSPPLNPAGLPVNFPPLELPEGSTVLSSDTREVGDGQTASETAFDSPVEPRRQYEALSSRLLEQGYEILESNFTEGERFAAYLITAQGEGLSLTITGGAGALAEQSEALANAKNPYVVIVGPGG